LGIHISNVGYLIDHKSPIDKEAFDRVKSTYVGTFFYRSMLPKELNSDVGSLV
jgi:exoribonuclease R